MQWQALIKNENQYYHNNCVLYLIYDRLGINASIEK